MSHMPWTAQLEDENGTTEMEDHPVVVEFGSLPGGESYPICRLIEASRHYDTLLNPIQIKGFLAEFDASSIIETETLLALKDLARRAEMVVHTYMRLIGD